VLLEEGVPVPSVKGLLETALPSSLVLASHPGWVTGDSTAVFPGEPQTIQGSLSPHVEGLIYKRNQNGGLRTGTKRANLLQIPFQFLILVKG